MAIVSAQKTYTYTLKKKHYKGPQDTTAGRLTADTQSRFYRLLIALIDAIFQWRRLLCLHTFISHKFRATEIKYASGARLPPRY